MSRKLQRTEVCADCSAPGTATIPTTLWIWAEQIDEGAQGRVVGGPQGPTPLSLSLSAASSEQENGQGFGSSLRPRVNSAGERRRMSTSALTVITSPGFRSLSRFKTVRLSGEKLLARFAAVP